MKYVHHVPYPKDYSPYFDRCHEYHPKNDATIIHIREVVKIFWGRMYILIWAAT
jgi:hypothetical protein